MDYGKQAFLILVLLSLLSPQFVSAFGVSPPAISADKLLKGSQYEATVFLIRANVEADLPVEATLRLPDEIKDWVTLDVGFNFVIPAGVHQFPVKVVISVPEDADLNIYNGSVVFNTLPPSEKGKGDQQVTITVAAGVNLNITVGEGVIKDFRIEHMDILDVKEGDPPAIVVTMENTGNVPVSAERATIDVLDKLGNVRLGFGQTEKLPEVPPFKTKKFVVEFPLDLELGLGEYWAEAKIYKSGSVAGEVKTVFNVVEKKFGLLTFLIIAVAVFGIGLAAKILFRRKYHG
ncbi:MAG: hypothetical protein V2A55_00540 [Candidatus Jorgensenbacteria bacterium]